MINIISIADIKNEWVCVINENNTSQLNDLQVQLTKLILDWVGTRGILSKFSFGVFRGTVLGWTGLFVIKTRTSWSYPGYFSTFYQQVKNDLPASLHV